MCIQFGNFGAKKVPAVTCNLCTQMISMMNNNERRDDKELHPTAISSSPPTHVNTNHRFYIVNN